MTRRENEIFDLIKENPFITQKDIAKKVGIKRSSVGVHIANLIKKGKIKGKCYILNQNDYAVVIGGSNIDLIGFSEESIILNDSNPGKLKISSGGVGRNIAENLARLGVSTKLLSAVGDDLYGEKLVNESRNAGVDISNVHISSYNRTSSYLSVIDNDGDMKLAIADMDISLEISVDYLEKYKQIIQEAKAIVIDTNLEKSVIEYIFNNFGDKEIFVDTVSTAKCIKINEYFEKIYTIKPNKIEAEKLLNMKINGNDDMEKAINKFLDLGVSQVVISNGSKEIYYGNSDGVFSVKAKKVNVVNATGAGDAFMAGLVYSYIKNIEINKAIIVSIEMSKLALESDATISNLVTEMKVLENLRSE
ncbi:MAG: carbohydrate kinase [Bacillota bacterium]|nr:carbohydrate kinase [Bacillota bacterium]